MNKVILSLMSDAGCLRAYFIAYAMYGKLSVCYRELDALYEELRSRGYDMYEVIDLARHLAMFGDENMRRDYAENFDEYRYDIAF